MIKFNEKFRPRKRFGQNFLQDETIIEQILSALKPNPKDNMIEIGPGLGALTRPLVDRIQHLDIIEIDRDLALKLQQEFQDNPKITLHVNDVLKFDFNSLFVNFGHNKNYEINETHETHENHAKYRIIGNLPYNISTELIFKLLPLSSFIKDMHFMLQKEVVDRIIATPNHKAYGRLSIMVQYYCKGESLFEVDPKSFYPPPKVTSSFLRLTPHRTLPFVANNTFKFAEITKVAFQYRRKTLQNALKNYISKEQLEALNIDPNSRAENLSIRDYVAISNFLSS